MRGNFIPPTQLKSETYRRVCSKCRIDRLFTPFAFDKFKGIKLKCTFCNSKTRYMNIEKAKEFEVKI